MEGRVQQHQIELLPAGREEAGRFADVDAAAVKDAAVLAVLHDDVHSLAVLVQEHAPGSAPAQRLNAQLAAACEQVQHPCPGTRNCTLENMASFSRLMVGG